MQENTATLARIEAPAATLARADRPRGLKLESLSDFRDFADLVIASRLAPRGMEKPEVVVIALIAGSELGFTPMQCLSNIGVINGKPAPYGDALPALVMDSGVCAEFDEWFEEDGERVESAPAGNLSGFSDSFSAVVSVRRRGRERARVQRFSVADAKRAQLWSKSGPWTQYPQRMLRFRALSFALRDEFPDVLRGFVAYEELQDYPQNAKPKAVVQAAPLASADEIADYNSLAVRASNAGYRTPNGNPPKMYEPGDEVTVRELDTRSLRLQEWHEAQPAAEPQELDVTAEGEVIEEAEEPQVLAPAPKPKRAALSRFWAIVNSRGLDASDGAREARMAAINRWLVELQMDVVGSVSALDDEAITELGTAVEDGDVAW